MGKRALNNSRQTAALLLLAAAIYTAVKILALSGLLTPYWLLVLDQALITTIGALGLCIIYGFAGQFSLGHAAFYGLGAYTAGTISKLLGHGSLAWFIAALPAGMLAAALVAFLIGLPILRLRSDYLGIATLGFGIIVKVGMDNSNKLFPVLGGATGMAGLPQVATFDFIFLFAVISVLLVRNFIHSSYGRSCKAIRDDEIAADIMGIDTTRSKVLAFVFGCALAGLAGALYAHRYPFIHPSSFDFLKSFDFLLIVVLGGLGSMTGTVITAIGWVFLLEGLRFVLGQQFIEFRGVIYALILVITILSRPQGIFGGKELGIFTPPRARPAVPGKEGEHAGSGN
ncbi:MAG: branched-chain amino acid ABC transporter permease [Pelotomaculum sp.]|uniref:ABC-type branched-chain amino acid transport system, permease component n=1 Tax=Pelotomaculum thermopropionicum (strain DSM 13744 / JCM 10971 / SI) TaxID=370438 RepID=A5D668_PELTS|nr:branched-chain amino acid ABC transporter permease [Pelotomaculum sp.]BAF58256.1 ABC-type branched-chain amino acid transport system, permease component [Pelotomaculum thermopropionicum SI]